MSHPSASRHGTVFVGSSFAAKYPEGGGNFSVPLQWVLGLRRMGVDFIWLEILMSTRDPVRDAANIRAFQRRLREFELSDHYCLLLIDAADAKTPSLEKAHFHGLTRRELADRLAGPNTLLNLSSSVEMPLLETFDRRIYCSLDPTEMCFWMSRMELGQSTHHAFWTIGLATNDPTIPMRRLAPLVVDWKTFFPMVDTTLLVPAPRPRRNRFTTVGQWYWDGCLEVDGEYPDFSKKQALAKFSGLPDLVPGAQFDLGIFLHPDDPEIDHVRAGGWGRPRPEIIARTPRRYYRFIRDSLAEFTPVKLEASMGSGWLSDRAAAYLAIGRPVVTEPTGAEPYLPEESGMFFVRTAEEAAEACQRVISDWPRLSKHARSAAVECFDSVPNLRRILGDLPS